MNNPVTQDGNKRPVVLANISYGLGNQMFQYAAARRLALANDAALWLLREGGFETKFQRAYELDLFNIAGLTLEQASPELAICPPVFLPSLTEARFWDFMGYSQAGRLLPGGPFLFIPAMLTWRGSVQLTGFWQNEAYFADAAAAIREDFTLKSPLDERNAACIARMRAAPSAFLHVRRGDYTQPDLAALFGACSLEYYAAALALLRSRHGDLNIFVFSDDPVFVREQQIGGPGAEIIDWNGPNPALDLTLMRHCQHAVIANSTFSWWGAWLGDHPGRTTIAPKTWIKAVPEFTEIIPDRWLRL